MWNQPKIIMLIFMWTTTTCLAKMVSQFSLKSVIANNVELIRFHSGFCRGFKDVLLLAEMSMHTYSYLSWISITVKLGLFEVWTPKAILHLMMKNLLKFLPVCLFSTKKGFDKYLKSGVDILPSIIWLHLPWIRIILLDFFDFT